MFATALEPVARRKELASSVSFGNAMATFLLAKEDTNGQFSLTEILTGPGTEPPYHIHDNEEETFYVLDGEVDVMVDGQIHHLTAGGAILLPRRVPHTFRIRSEKARLLNFCTPGGFEGYFKSLGQPSSAASPAKMATREEYIALAENAARQFGVRLAPTQPEF